MAKSRSHLHVVTRRPSRASVIVDMHAPRITLDEMVAMAPGGSLPEQAFVGAFVAAWAHAEGCEFWANDTVLEFSCQQRPSPALRDALDRTRMVIGWCLGIAAPVVRANRRREPTYVMWPAAHRWGGN